MYRERMRIAEAAVGLVFFIVALAAIIFSRHTGEAAIVWPASAIAAALYVRLPRVRLGPTLCALMLAGVAANKLAAGDPLAVAAGLTGIDVAEILVTAWLFRLKFGANFAPAYPSFEQGLWMCGLFTFLGPGLGALPGGLMVHAAFADPVWLSVASWGLSSAYGACLFAPPIYLYSKTSLQRLIARRFVALNIALFAAALVATWLSIRYVSFPFVVIGVALIAVAFRLGGFGTACLSTMTGTLVIGLWIAGVRPHGLNAPDLPLRFSALPFFALLSTLLAPIAVGLLNDDKHRTLRRLRASERRFRESIACAPIGMALVDLHGAWIATNSAFVQMLDYSEAQALAGGLDQLLHPDEREPIERQLHSLLAGRIDRHDGEYRYRHKDGSWIRARVVVSLVKDDDANPLHFFWQIESLQAQRRAESNLAEEHNRLQTTLRSIADAVITTDIGGLITFVNAAAEKLLERTESQVLGLRPDEIIVLTDPRTGKSLPGTLGRCVMRLELVSREEPCLLHRPDGSICYILDTASPVTDAEGRFNGAVIILRDATEAQARARELAHRATHDLLTNLANRFEFERRAQTCFERGRLVDRPAVLLVIDLDRFKQVNDRGGHAAGDAMLCAVAKALLSQVRAADTVARLGGDEFAIILDGCNPHQAQAVSAKILQAAQAIDLPWNGTHYSIGASIGAAVLIAQFADVEAWTAAADRACYAAKQQGRGQLRFA